MKKKTIYNIIMFAVIAAIAAAAILLYEAVRQRG